MTFEVAYAGAKSVYLFARDVSGVNSGWQQLSTWRVPFISDTPAAFSVTPYYGSGSIQTLTLLYSDTDGATNLKLVYAWFNTGDAVNNSCELYYNVGTNQINLLNDAATAWMSAALGATTPLQNSQCVIESG